jgi:hypothetical protein
MAVTSKKAGNASFQTLRHPFQAHLSSTDNLRLRAKGSFGSAVLNVETATGLSRIELSIRFNLTIF